MTYLALRGADIIGPDIYEPARSTRTCRTPRRQRVTYVGAYRGVTFGAAYSFGRDARAPATRRGRARARASAGDAVHVRNWSVMLKYDSAYFGAAASYEEQPRHRRGRELLRRRGARSVHPAAARTHT